MMETDPATKNKLFDAVSIFFLCSIVGGVVSTMMRWGDYPVALMGLALTFHCAQICSINLRESKRQTVLIKLLADRIGQVSSDSRRQTELLEDKLNANAILIKTAAAPTER